MACTIERGHGHKTYSRLSADVTARVSVCCLRLGRQVRALPRNVRCMEQIGNWGFWLGLLLALPIGIVTNLFTPRVQTWWARRSQRMASDRDQERREQAALVARYRRDQAAYWSYLYLSLTRILLRVAMLLAALIVPYLIGEFLWDLDERALIVFIFNVFVLVLAVGTFAALLNDIRRTRSVVSAIAAMDEDARTESPPQP